MTDPTWAHVPRSIRWRIALRRWIAFSFSNGARWPDWRGPAWFNLGVGFVLIVTLPPALGCRGWCIAPWNAFRRHYSDGSKQWGFGLLQIGGRHLLYQGYTRGEDGRESWCTDVLFVRLVKHEAWAR